jgi:hypothetical protein
MAIPITINCECGRRMHADLGDRVTCQCGRVYDTGTAPQGQRAAVAAAQRQVRLYTWFGMLLIAGAALGGFLVYGIVGSLLAAPAVSALWFRFVQPRAKQRRQAALAELPSWTVEAEP